MIRGYNETDAEFINRLLFEIDNLRGELKFYKESNDSMCKELYCLKNKYEGIVNELGLFIEDNQKLRKTNEFMKLQCETLEKKCNELKTKTQLLENEEGFDIGQLFEICEETIINTLKSPIYEFTSLDEARIKNLKIELSKTIKNHKSMDGRPVSEISDEDEPEKIEPSKEYKRVYPKHWSEPFEKEKENEPTNKDYDLVTWTKINELDSLINNLNSQIKANENNVTTLVRSMWKLQGMKAELEKG